MHVHYNKPYSNMVRFKATSLWERVENKVNKKKEKNCHHGNHRTHPVVPPKSKTKSVLWWDGKIFSSKSWRTDRTQRGPCLMIEGQIFSRPARTHSATRAKKKKFWNLNFSFTFFSEGTVTNPAVWLVLYPVSIFLSLPTGHGDAFVNRWVHPKFRCHFYKYISLFRLGSR